VPNEARRRIADPSVQRDLRAVEEVRVMGDVFD